jgi:RHS repeat-associated protein
MRCYNGASGDCTSTAVTAAPTKIATTTTLANGKSSQVVTTLMSQGLPTEVDAYDFGATAPTRKTITTYAALGNNIQDRPQTLTVYDGSGNVYAQKSYAYDEYSPTLSGVSGLSTISGSRGNLTTVKSLVSGASTISTHFHYDDAGQLVSSTDGNGNTTSYGYDPTDTYITSKTYPPVPAGTFSESYVHDNNTGLLTQSKDVNQQSTTYSYDSMLRNTAVGNPDGGYVQTAYSSANQMTVGVLLPTGTFATSTNQYDGYGRLAHSTDAAGNTTDISYDSMGRQYSVSNPHSSASNNSDGTVYYGYDMLGRMTKLTNQDGSVQYYCYDGVATAAQPNCQSHLGSGANTGTWIDFQDEQGNQWQRSLDAFGRITEVMEPNGVTSASTMETDYGYDVLNNLIAVTQWGGPSGSSNARTRGFSYDNLSRLITASNPETGSITYSYDANGNLISKKDARITINYSPSGSPIDALNRVTGKSYSDNTPPVTYTYDSGLYGIGRLTSGASVDANGVPVTSSFAYDPMGRMTSSTQCANSVCGTTTAHWNLAGGLASLTYPSSRAVTYSYDSAARLSAVVFDNFNGSSVNYPYYAVNQAGGYWPSGLVRTAQIGNGLYEFTHENNRLQVDGFTVSTSGALSCGSNSGANLMQLGLNYSPTNNNGNVLGITDYINSNHSQTFNYDTLSRVSSAVQSDNAFNQLYTIDAWGNMSQSGPPNMFQQPFTVNNQVQGFCYDASGNLLDQGGCSNPHAYTYDAANRVVALSGITAYTYDANGLRVVKNLGGSAIQYFYFGGQPIAELNINTWSDYIFAGSKRVAVSTSAGAQDPNGTQAATTTTYYHGDHLGSARMMTTGTILTDGSTPSYATYAPFGQLVSGDVPSHYKFTGKERDTETGLDYFGARYYASSMGRFSSPDPSGLYYADPTNPQSFNLYGYVMNNPLTNIDPNGLDCIHINNDTGEYEGFESGDCDNSTTEKSNSGQYIDGTVNTIDTTTGDTSGVVTGYDGTSSDGNLMAGTFGTAQGQQLDTQMDPDDARIQQLAIGITEDSQHSFGCFAQAYGVGAPSAAIGQAGSILFNASQNLVGKARFGGALGGSTSFTSEAAMAARSSSWGSIPFRVPTPVGTPFTGSFAMRSSSTLGGAAGRYAPYVGAAGKALGAAGVAYSSYRLWNCL